MSLRIWLIGLVIGVLGCSDVTPDVGASPVGAPDAGDSPPPPPPPPTAAVFAHTRDSLYTVDPSSFELSFVGMFGSEESITDLAVTPDGRVFGISGESLYSVSATTGKATFVADVPGELNVGLTFLPSGQLLATDKDGNVREVSPDTGVISEIGKFGNGWGTAGDLVAVADGTMFAIGESLESGPSDSNVLLTVDTSSGAAAYIGELGFRDVFGSAYSNGRVYAFTSGGEIIEIDPSTGQGVLVRHHADISFWGAAVTPLVSVE